MSRVTFLKVRLTSFLSCLQMKSTLCGARRPALLWPLLTSHLSPPTSHCPLVPACCGHTALGHVPGHTGVLDSAAVPITTQRWIDGGGGRRQGREKRGVRGRGACLRTQEPGEPGVPERLWGSRVPLGQLIEAPGLCPAFAAPAMCTPPRRTGRPGFQWARRGQSAAWNRRTAPPQCIPSRAPVSRCTQGPGRPFLRLCWPGSSGQL